MANRQQRRQAGKKLESFDERVFTLRRFLMSPDDVARHHEVWALLQHYHRHVIEGNRWWRCLLRKLRGQEWKIDPFTWWENQLRKAQEQLEAQAKADAAEAEA